jgi:hypothetical protein
MLEQQNIGSAVVGPQSAPDSPQGSAPALISRRAYAKLRGVDDKTIRKAIAAGKIPLVGGLIDPVVADAAWARNRDAGQESKLALAAAAVPTLVRPATQSAFAQPAAEDPARPGVVSTIEAPKQQQPEVDLAPLTAARIANTQESTAIKEITRRKLEGSLLEVEDVERTWGQLVQILKDRLRLIPDNLAPALAACTEEAECRSILMREILDSLSAMSKTVAGMVA